MRNASKPAMPATKEEALAEIAVLRFRERECENAGLTGAAIANASRISALKFLWSIA